MFSKELELSIASLFDKAHEANIQYITVEHLLLMILNDFDVKEFFKSEGINIESIKNDLNDHLKKKTVVTKYDQQKNCSANTWFPKSPSKSCISYSIFRKGCRKTN